MAVLKFADVHKEEGTYGESGQRTDYYAALVDDLTTAQADLRLHRPDLQRWQPHPTELGLFVDRFRADLREGQFWYDIRVEYSSRLTIPTDPLAAPAGITWETTEISEQVQLDAHGRPLLNHAGSPLLDIEDERSLWVIQITKNVADVPSWLLDYGYWQPVNSDSVSIRGQRFPPRTLKLSRIRIGDWQSESDIDYLPLSLTLIHHPKTWDRQYLNRGTYELRLIDELGRQQPDWPAGPRPPGWKFESVLCTDQNGAPVSEPVFLNRKGRRPRLQTSDPTQLVTNYADGVIKHPLDPSDIVNLQFRVKQELPFRVLPLK